MRFMVRTTFLTWEFPPSAGAGPQAEHGMEPDSFHFIIQAVQYRCKPCSVVIGRVYRAHPQKLPAGRFAAAQVAFGLVFLQYQLDLPPQGGTLPAQPGLIFPDGAFAHAEHCRRCPHRRAVLYNVAPHLDRAFMRARLLPNRMRRGKGIERGKFSPGKNHRQNGDNYSGRQRRKTGQSFLE